MDIDTMRLLLREGRYVTTREFHRRGDRRGFTLVFITDYWKNDRRRRKGPQAR